MKSKKYLLTACLTMINLLILGCALTQSMASSPTPSSTLTPNGPAQIKGILVDADGKPVKWNIFVTSNDPTATPGVNPDSDVPQSEVVLGENGTFVIKNVPAGEYTIYFADSIFHISETNSRKVKVGPGESLDLGNIIVK
jgi:hypothetical protein